MSKEFVGRLGEALFLGDLNICKFHIFSIGFQDRVWKSNKHIFDFQSAIPVIFHIQPAQHFLMCYFLTYFVETFFEQIEIPRIWLIY